jgi:hypothetical protein
MYMTVHKNGWRSTDLLYPIIHCIINYAEVVMKKERQHPHLW